MTGIEKFIPKLLSTSTGGVSLGSSSRFNFEIQSVGSSIAGADESSIPISPKRVS